MRLDLNLASRPFVNRTPQALLLVILLVGAVAATSWNVITVARSASEARAVEGRLAKLKAEEEELRAEGVRLHARLDDVDIKPLTIRAQAANDVLAQKALSWSLLLQRLEEVLPWKAALQSIRASVGADGVRLQLKVRARSQDEVLDFLDALEASPCFEDAYPLDEGGADSADFTATIDVAHDPYCGNAPQLPAGTKARGALSRKGGRRG